LNLPTAHVLVGKEPFVLLLSICRHLEAAYRKPVISEIKFERQALTPCATSASTPRATRKRRRILTVEALTGTLGDSTAGAVRRRVLAVEALTRTLDAQRRTRRE
jgi:hypothetical protein